MGEECTPDRHAPIGIEGTATTRCVESAGSFLGGSSVECTFNGTAVLETIVIACPSTLTWHVYP
jgi:hypothetical protein